MSTFLDPPAIKQSIMQLVCEACGAEAHASCACGKPYLPKAHRAAEAIAKDPTKSDRAIAGEIGVSPTTVGKARDQVSSGGHLNGADQSAREAGGEQSPPEQRVGKDGKRYSIRKPERVPPPPIRRELIDQALAIIREMDHYTWKRFDKLYAMARPDLDVEYF